MYYFVGLPGHQPRLAIDGEVQALAQVQDGEVCLVHDDPRAELIISADGLTLEAFTPPIERLRAHKWWAAKEKREAIINGGISVPGIGVFDSDELSRQNVSGAALAAQASLVAGLQFSVEWTLKDNSRVTLDAQQVITVHLTGVSFINSIHAHASDLRDLIEAATTESDIEAIDINADWPI